MLYVLQTTENVSTAGPIWTHQRWAVCVMWYVFTRSEHKYKWPTGCQHTIVLHASAVCDIAARRASADDHRSLSPSANRPAQLAGPTHPPQTRRPHPHCPPARRDVPRAVAAPSPAVSVSKSTAVDSVTTWVLRLRRDGHIGFEFGTGPWFAYPFHVQSSAKVY